MNNRDKNLNQLVEIIKKNKFSLEEISQALSSVKKESSLEKPIIVSELLSYIGGILLFAGIGIYTSTFWHEMSSVSRILITLGSGISCYSMGLLFSDNTHHQYKLINTLFLIAAFLQPLGLFVLLDELFGMPANILIPFMLISGCLFLQQVVTFVEKRSGLLLFTTLYFGLVFLISSFEYMEASRRFVLMGVGASLFFVIYSLKDSPYSLNRGFWYFWSSAFVSIGFFDLVRNTSLELFYLGMGCFIIYLSIITRSKAILFSGVFSLLGYIAYFSNKHFLHSAGWPITLIFLGLSFIGISAIAVRINRKYLQT